jgi:hypothetical protein
LSTVLTKAIDAGASVTIAERLSATPKGIAIRYLGPSTTFVVEEVLVGGEVCAHALHDLVADAQIAEWNGAIVEGTTLLCKVRNVSAAPATFVASIDRQ